MDRGKSIKLPYMEGIVNQIPTNGLHAGGASAYRRGRVNTADIKIRQLTPGDAALYRSIRLEGLKESPEAFGSTFDAEFTKPLAWFFDRLSSSVVFGAIRDAKLLDAKILGAKILGVAGFAVRDGEKEAHKGLLWGMYVRPDARGAGMVARNVGRP